MTIRTSLNQAKHQLLAQQFDSMTEYKILAVVKDGASVKAAKPDLAKITQLAERGFLLTAQDASGEADFIYRAFFPKLDMPEDPVTGSAITALGPYWAKIMNKTVLCAYQASARGGALGVEVTRARVLISSKAVTVFKGVMSEGIYKQAADI